MILSKPLASLEQTNLPKTNVISLDWVWFNLETLVEFYPVYLELAIFELLLLNFYIPKFILITNDLCIINQIQNKKVMNQKTLLQTASLFLILNDTADFSGAPTFLTFFNVIVLEFNTPVFWSYSCGKGRLLRVVLNCFNVFIELRALKVFFSKEGQL